MKHVIFYPMSIPTQINHLFSFWKLHWIYFHSWHFVLRTFSRLHLAFLRWKHRTQLYKILSSLSQSGFASFLWLFSLRSFNITYKFVLSCFFLFLPTSTIILWVVFLFDWCVIFLWCRFRLGVSMCWWELDVRLSMSMPDLLLVTAFECFILSCLKLLSRWYFLALFGVKFFLFSDL